ncbi:hypothetical protein REPUB_Repub06bG0154800 [Reevesia pubescens]
MQFHGLQSLESTCVRVGMINGVYYAKKWAEIRNQKMEEALNQSPEMWYGSAAEINHARWSPAELDWIAIGFLNKLQLLKV